MKKKLIFILTAIMTMGIPLPTFAVYKDLTQAQADRYYSTYMGIGTLVFAAIAIGMFFYWLMLRNDDKAAAKRKKKKTIAPINEKRVLSFVWLIIGIGLFVRLVAAIPAPGFENDIGLFRYWGTTAANDFVNTYNTLGSNIDYPPGYVYILGTCGFIAKILGLSNTVGYTLIIKLPAILADCGIAFFIYKFCKGRVPEKWTYFLVILWMANPLAIIDSTFWGQVDSVLTLALVIGLYFISEEKYLISAAVFGVAIMLKPQAIIVLPVLGYAVLKEIKFKSFKMIMKGVGKTALAVVVGLGTAIVVALPFALNVDMNNDFMKESVTPVLEMLHADGGGTLTKIMTPFAWILSLFMGTAGHYDYACVNALNYFFALGGNWVKDSEPFLGIEAFKAMDITWFKVGMAFIVLSALVTWFVYIVSKKSKSLPFIAAATILLLVANFGPRMHERYFFPAVIFLMIAAILRNNKLLFGLSVAASAFGFFTVLEVLVDLNLGVPYMWPQVSFVRSFLSVGNCTIAIAAMVFAIVDSFVKIDSKKLNVWRSIE